MAHVYNRRQREAVERELDIEGRIDARAAEVQRLRDLLGTFRFGSSQESAEALQTLARDLRLSLSGLAEKVA